MVLTKEKVEEKDANWWLGPLGVLAVVALVLFALARNPGAVPLDHLPDRIGAKARRAITGKHRAMWLGMEVSPLSRANATEFGINPKLKGVVITDSDNGQGANAGMNVGDVIVGINGTKITDFESFLWLAKQSKFSDGIFLDVITNGKRRYVSVPFHFNGGPLMGPKANHWQLGAPANNPAFGYGKLVAFPNNANTGQGMSQFLICPNCGHSSPAANGQIICPNCGIQMLRNQ